MQFDDKYTEYWRTAVDHPVDGIEIPGGSQVELFLREMSIKIEDNVLDLGCSYGRMFAVLSKFTSNVFGVDPEESAVIQARITGYLDARVGSAENIPFASNFFNQVFCWAVFEIVDQTRTLIEANRVLIIGGECLISGKNYAYYENDEAAFIAEKNAFLKDFKQNFTNLDLMIDQLSLFGFKLKLKHHFAQRGDLAKTLRREDIVTDPSTNECYEFVVVLEKINEIDFKNFDSINQFSFDFSKTAKSRALSAGSTDIPSFFRYLGLN